MNKLVNKLYKNNYPLKLTAMNISYYDFTNLPDQQSQCNMVMTNGRVMNERTVDRLKYVLYEISCFTVEIIYNTSTDKISGMNIYQNKAAYAI